ncbi:hypothetical protein DMN77_18615 [Paenibacillus sp. 79R4]|uniref:hypothetical protein n=1 Tax=Paenibacillus sp. 79R4 TaxID=2212847 RepID=UPI001DDE4A30|nr:hypothetical protein [Paenibacillus sp. 79R4]NWL89564.1 hypothetical protein [Paenibacillus sp. 79R4]
MLYHIWVRHHLRPGAFWSLPKGERTLLTAFTLHEIDVLTKPTPSSLSTSKGKGRRVIRGR